MRIEVSKRIKAGEHPLAPFTLRLAVDGFDVRAALTMLEQILEDIRASAGAGEGAEARSVRAGQAARGQRMRAEAEGAGVGLHEGGRPAQPPPE
jgi:hypothetical protein